MMYNTQNVQFIILYFTIILLHFTAQVLYFFDNLKLL